MSHESVSLIVLEKKLKDVSYLGESSERGWKKWIIKSVR